VEPVICPPRRPDKKPVVERCIGTLKHEWLARFSPTTLFDAHRALERFPHYYNETRPHQGRACQNQPPAVAFPTLPGLPTLPEKVAPNQWLQAIHGRVYRRRVNSNGTIQVDRHTYPVGARYAKQLVLVHVDALQQAFHFSVEGQLVKTVPIQGLYGMEMDFNLFLVAMCSEARLIALHRQALWERPGN
jgi:hypothetical protein